MVSGYALNATVGLASGLAFFLYKMQRYFNPEGSNFWRDVNTYGRFAVGACEMASVCLLTYSVYTIKKLLSGKKSEVNLKQLMMHVGSLCLYMVALSVQLGFYAYIKA